jgi:hypothetical protein
MRRGTGGNQYRGSATRPSACLGFSLPEGWHHIHQPPYADTPSLATTTSAATTATRTLWANAREATRTTGKSSTPLNCLTGQRQRPRGRRASPSAAHLWRTPCAMFHVKHRHAVKSGSDEGRARGSTRSLPCAATLRGWTA